MKLMEGRTMLSALGKHKRARQKYNQPKSHLSGLKILLWSLHINLNNNYTLKLLTLILKYFTLLKPILFTQTTKN